MHFRSNSRKLLGSSFEFLLIVSFFIAPLASLFPFVWGAPGDWWNTSWAFRKSVTVNHAKIGSTLGNFPVLVDITDPNLSASARSDGYDIVFVDNSTNLKLNHQIESFDKSTGHLVAWVNVPSVSPTTDTVLYIYYGNPASGNQQNPTAVWDSNYMLVQHLNEKSGSTCYDSTSNKNDGTVNSNMVRGATGKIDSAYTFDGATSFVQVPHSSSLSGFASSFTASFWLSLDDVSKRQSILQKYNTVGNQRGWMVEYRTDVGRALALLASSNGVSFDWWYASFNPTAGTWYYVTVVWQSNAVPKFFVNGQQVSTVRSSVISQIYSASGAPLHVGKSTYQSGREFKGTLDETCLSNVARSSAWILTCYNNQKAPSTFYTIGSEENQSIGSIIISNENPTNGATNVYANPQLSIIATDTAGRKMTIVFNTNCSGLWKEITRYSDVGNGVYSCVPADMKDLGTKYFWSVNATDGIVNADRLYSLTTTTTILRDWQYRRTITIDHTKVSSDQTDFPVLIDLTDNGLTTKVQANGNDFVFTDANQVKLSHEIESYSSGTGHLVVWVKVPVLSSTTDTVLYMYYGNSACGDQQTRNAVWDSSNRMILHLAETSGTQYDSTINKNNATPYNGIVQGVGGKIDGSDTFDGTNDYLQIPHNGTLTGFSQGFTASFWLRLNDVSRRQTILNKYNSATGQRSWYIDYQNNLLGFFASQDGSNYAYWNVTFRPTAGTWYFITITWEPNAVPKFYVNGAQVTTTGTAKIASIYNNAEVPLYIGRCPYDATRYLKGSLDEIRISNPARNAGWILSSYNNQKDPTTFYQLGTEEAQEPPRYTMTVDVNGQGSVTKIPDQLTYANNTSVQLTAVPNSGWTFQTWSGDLSGNTNPATITINGDKVVKATFVETGSALGIDSSFDSASIGAYKIGGNEINFTLATESLTTGEVYTYWTYFRVTNTLDREVTFRITNAATVTFLSTPSKEAEMVYSYNGDNWLRFTNHSYSGGIYTFTGNFTNNEVYVATFFPFTYTEMQEYTNAVDASPWAVKTVPGLSQQGRDIALLKITNPSIPDNDKKVIYIIGRQHSAETCSSHMLRGMIDFLTSSDTDAQRMRDNFVWYIVPMVNPDGVYIGKSRATSENRNANRDWKNDQSAEINIVRDHINSINNSVGIDFFIDWHSQMDDDSWYNYVYSPPGNTFFSILSAWTDFDTQFASVPASGSVSSCTAREYISNNIVYDPMFVFEPTPHLHSWTIASLEQEGVNVAYAIDEYFTLEPFAIIVLPDTQFYSQSYPTIFNNQTQWIVNNVEDLNILFVLHEGDIVNNDVTAQWINGNASMSLLDEHVPWAVLPGNHDGTNVGAPDEDLSNYNSYFPYSRFSGKTWYGDAYNSINTNSFMLFSGGYDDYIIFNFQYHPSDAVLSWANTTIAAYPDRRAIVVTHDYLNTDGTRTTEGDHIWNSFVLHHAAQIFLVLCGHMHGEARRQDTINGHVVYQVLADYQSRANGGDGLLRILEFHSAQDAIYVKTFSPYHNIYEIDADSQFTLDYDMSVPVFLTSADPDLTSPSGYYRWMDVASQTYSSDYQDSYNYTQATVHVSYNTVGESLTGKMIAQNLKPNFAYQLKLAGTPGTIGNELIGFAGRWWEEEWNGTSWTNGQNLNNKGTGSSPNPNDNTYLSRNSTTDASSPTGLHYRYTGYLLFGYFITDNKGNATLYFETGSCYHVLWKTSQRAQTTDDGLLKTVTFDPTLSLAYDVDYPSSTVSIFGEWERLPMGSTNLAAGSYNCQIVLTEESFHGTGPLEGNWAAAMSTNISFMITH